jgi:diketogulonate reductase-like aldo/keto reductase
VRTVVRMTDDISFDASRRTVLKAAGAGALLAAGGGLGSAAAATGELIIRPIPRSTTGERLPVIGLGTFMTFDRLPHTPRSHLLSVIDTFWRAGGRVIDTSALYGASEVNVGEFARRLGITDRMFLADKSWNCGEYAFDPSHTLRQFGQSLERLSRQRLDVVGIHSMTNVGMVLPILRRLKSEGSIRYVGLTSHEPYQYDGMEPAITAGTIDFIQVRYSIYERVAEERLLSLAADHGVAVMVNMALEKARLHHVVAGRPLPRFATEFGIRNWTEYFLKYVIAHPAVTCVVPATTDPEHAAENVRAMRGPLPDRQLRRRMVHHMRTIPGFDRIASMPWYPGKVFEGGLVKLPDPRPAG